MRGGNRGVALVQALVIAAALAGVSAALLVRAQGAVARLDAGQDAQALLAALDAGQVLLADLVATLPPEGAVTLDQPWAQPRTSVEMGDARLAWQMQDLGGLFDLSSLTSEQSDPAMAFETFLALAAQAGIAPPQAAALAAHAAERLPPDTRRLLDAAGALPADAPQDLLDLLTLRDGTLQINVNTAPAEVIAALAPDVSPAAIARLVRQRDTRPFDGAGALADWLMTNLSEDDAQILGAAPLVTDSAWFGFRLSASLDSQRLERSGVIRRADQGGGAEISYAVTHP